MSDPTSTEPAEIQHALRGLSHDMGAAQMMLEHSFGRLKSLLQLCPKPKKAVPAELQSQLAEMEACMKASKDYLDDLVRLSTAGAAEMEPKPVDTRTAVHEVLLEQAELLRQRKIEVTVQDLLPVVWCHPVQLKRILTNLIRNAALHGGDPQNPRIEIAPCARIIDDESLASLRIFDNGPGIDPRRHREIFLPGRRLGNTLAEGSGWGLPAARQIAERFSGSLTLERDCRMGTAFILTLPDASEAVQPAESEPVEDGRQWRLQLDARHRASQRHAHAQREASHTDCQKG